jgi:TetR/AcrR family transcriptional regulator, mexJK operon transcriptional repressor
MALSTQPKKPRSPKLTAIVEAAKELFAQYGYDGTSTEMIAEAAGVSRQTIYNQFDSKEQLFQELATDIVNAIVGPLGSEDEAGAEPRAALLALAERTLATLFAPRTIALRRLAITEFGRFPHLGRAIYNNGPVQTRGKLTAYLAEQARLGTMRVPQPELAAEHFFALVTGPSDLRILLGVETSVSPELVRERAANAVDTFFRAFGID